MPATLFRTFLTHICNNETEVCFSKRIKGRIYIQNVDRIHCLHSINWPSLRIPVTMYYNSIIAFVNEMCATADVIKIRSLPSPVVHLLERQDSEWTLEKKKNSDISPPTCLGWATNQTWQEWCWANRLTIVRTWLTYSVSVLLNSVSIQIHITPQKDFSWAEIDKSIFICYTLILPLFHNACTISHLDTIHQPNLTIFLTPLCKKNHSQVRSCSIWLSTRISNIFIIFT